MKRYGASAIASVVICAAFSQPAAADRLSVHTGDLYHRDLDCLCYMPRGYGYRNFGYDRFYGVHAGPRYGLYRFGRPPRAAGVVFFKRERDPRYEGMWANHVVWRYPVRELARARRR
jgi:hypothetical protein